jgi:hypothetical protein
MPDKRVDALNSLNKNDYNSKYVTLSDNTKIGVDLITDLIKYFELEFKNKYRYDYLKWTKINVPSNEIYRYNPQPLKDCGPAPAVIPAVHPPTGAASPPAPAAVAVAVSAMAGAATATASGETSAKYKIIFGDDEKKDENDKKVIEKLKNLLKNNTEKKYDILIDLSEALATATAAAAEKKTEKETEAKKTAEAAKITATADAKTAAEAAKKELEEAKKELEEAKKEKLRKNYRDSSINLGYKPIIEISCTKESPVYFTPSLVDNYTDYDFQEKSQIYDDLNKLNSIFKKNNYADLDDLVILDFYKDFTKKVEKLKGDIISRDDDVKYDLIDNIYDKLAIIYEIKIGRNKKIVKKPIKEVIGSKPAANATYTPKDICLISKDDTNNLFNEILCEINKRAQIFNNLKKGGKQAKRGGKPHTMSNESKDTLEKLFDAIKQSLPDRKQTFEDIDKNILNKLMADYNIVNKSIENSIKNVSGNIQFNAFNLFIEEIKNMTVKESNRYLNIIKSLNLIKNKTLGTRPSPLSSHIITSLNRINSKAPETLPLPLSSQDVKKGGAYQKGNAGNVNMNQGDKRIQKQANEENKNTGNPGKEYLKNLKDIYINLAKEYGKFIKDENKLKETIKKVIKSQEDIEKDNVSESSDNESKKKELTDKKKEDIENNFNLREKEYKNIEQKIKKVQSTFNELDRKENNELASYYIKKIEIEGLNANYIELYANFKDIKEDLIAFLLTNDKETTDLKAKENALQKTKGVLKAKDDALKTTKETDLKAKDDAFKEKDEDLKAKEEEINKLIDKYRLIYNNNASELASEETKKELEELENQNKENEKKSKNLEERKKQLTASLKVIKEELRKLYKACIDINLPYATEYNDFVKNIIKVGQLKYIIDDNPQINNNNEIIDAYNKEIDRIDKELGDIKIDITSNAKKINDKKEITKSQGQGINNPRYPRGGASYGGGTKEDEEKEKENLRKLLNGNLYELIKEDRDNNLYDFIKELKSVFDNDDDNEVGQDNASGKKYNEKETLYEQIWKDYSDGVKAYYSNQKGKNPLTYINEGEKLKNKVILYDLDPEIVLKITFQDKVVFLALMFAIRTMIMVLFEFLIDYNIVKSLRYAILIYAVFYILILLLFTAFVNLDSYKLRIVFNYLNMHINTPGIILHIMLFIIFSLLVIIIIQTDNFVNNLGDILDYTYIYNYIYTFNFDNILSGEFENNLTKDEKIKLQYRLDIISMLIFIFSGTLILLM